MENKDSDAIRIMKNISNTIIESGKTDKEIARLTKLNYRTINNYRNMKTLPSFDNFEKLIIALNLDENEISKIFAK